MKTKLFTLFFALMASVGTIFAQSGTCGDNLTWNLTDSVLTISGTGEMDDYNNYGFIPWYSDRDYIRSVVINDGVTSIGESAFHECTNLSSIEIPNSVTYIGGGAFSYCTSLSSCEVPNSVTSIGSGAFRSCSSLVSVTLPDSLVRIESFIFDYCTSLTSIEIPDSVKSIGDYAFEWCTGLTSIEIPDGVISIGDRVFWDCKNLTSVTLPNSVTSVGYGAFYDTKLSAPLYNAHVFAHMPRSYSGAYTIPDGIESIAGGACSYCTKLTSIEIPNSVTEIGVSTFNGCSGLTTAIIGSSITSIGWHAFDGWTSLTSLTNYATTPQDIQENAVFGYTIHANCILYVPAESVAAYQAADGWKEFGTILAIGETPELCIIASGTCGAQGDNLTWSLSCDSVLTISGTGEMKDYGWNVGAPWKSKRDSIRLVVITDGVTSIGSMAFASCNNMISVEIPNSVTSIGVDAFYYSSSLSYIELPNSVTSIGESAFTHCTGLISIEIPNSITSIERFAFTYCTSLTSVTIPNSVTSIGYGAFFDCSSLDSVEIPNSVTSIGDDAFGNCSSLTSIEIPNSVTSIGYQAFYYCNGLISVTLPNSVTSIGNRAFYSCYSLTSITNYATTPQTITTSVFNSVNKTYCTLYVPAESVAAYQAADVWKEFGNILPIEGTEPTGNECSDPKILSWEPVEHPADMDRWYRFLTTEESDNPIYGSFTPIIPDTCDLRIKINNLSDENANVHADVYFECNDPAIKAKSYMLPPYESSYFDIDRDLLEVMGWADMLLNFNSDQNISIKAELIPDMPRDTLRDTIVAYVCQGDMFEDTIPYNWKIIDMVDHSMTWKDTIEFRDGLQMKDSIIMFNIHPLIMPEPLSAEEMRGIGAAPLLVQGMQLYVDESNAALTEYYRNLGNTVDTITHIDTAYWAKPVYYADGSLNLTKEAPLDLSKYYSKNEYMDTLLLVVKSEECDFIMRIEYIFPIEGYKYVFRNDTICPPDPYYNPDTLTSIMLDTLGLPRMVDTITIYYSMLQPALYSQDEISLLPFVANGQPIDTTFTLSALKQQFADDATNLTARVTNIKWQVLEGDVWMDMPYVVSQTATEIHMRYIVETECAIRDTSMNIILPLTPEPCLIASGTCGTNLTWTLTCDSVLTISGTGAMWDYLNPSDEPWYSYRSSITSLVIEDNVTSISWNFRGLTGLTSVVIGNSITNIESGAFEGCTGLSSLTIGNHVTSIGTAAFYQCLGLTSIEIPNSVTSIGNHAFWNCFYVTSPVYIHNNVTNIGADAFGACSIPSFEVNSDNSNYCAVDGVLFDKTKHTLIQYPGGNPRTEYTIPETVTSIEYGAFDGAELLTSITIGNNVTSIGNEAFSFCMGLTSIEIPNSVTSIERFTFSYCSNLTSVVLPNSIVNINDGAFAYCRNLTSFTNYATTPQTLKDEYVFSDVNLSNCTLYVPAQSIAAYQTADVWKEFGNILPIEEPIVEPTDSVYEVVYLDQAGLQLDSEPIILHLPVAPVIEGFSFLKWQVVAGDLENGIYIQAVYTANEPTNAPEVYTNPANKAQKLIRNGKVYILTDDKVYSISGQKVK